MKKPHSGKRQYGALAIGLDGDSGIKVVLITSRDTGRWVIPKGWPMRGKAALEVALVEAYEEAGIVGRALIKKPVGTYRYRKVLASGLEANLRVGVFVVLVDTLLEDWPERGQRVVEWFTPYEAAALVAEPDLAKLIRRLPRKLAKIA